MAEKNTNRRSPRTPGSFLMGMAAVLFCLVAFSTYLMGGLYARYTTQNQGSDSARVAKFDISVDKPENIEIQYGITEHNTTDYTLTFHNQSEVAVAYSIVVVVDKAEEQSFNIEVTLEGITLDTEHGSTLDFGVVDHIPSASDNTCDLTFAVADWNDFTALGSGASRELSLDFTVFITVTQVD